MHPCRFLGQISIVDTNMVIQFASTINRSPKKPKNGLKSSFSLYFWPMGAILDIYCPTGGPPRDFEWGSPREGKGFGRGIERRSKCVHLVPQTSPKRMLPGRLLIPYIWPKMVVQFCFSPFTNEYVRWGGGVNTKLGHSGICVRRG